jgi:hypothetical protein
MDDPIRTRENLEKAIPDIGYAIHQCLAHNIYRADIHPYLKQQGIDAIKVGMTTNASLESNLLFLRRLNEFFKPLSDGYVRPDDLRAEHYWGFKSPGPFLSSTEESEINKRVGHITLSEARLGKKNWTELLTKSRRRIIKSSLIFYFFLYNSYCPASSPQMEEVLFGIMSLSALLRYSPADSVEA